MIDNCFYVFFINYLQKTIIIDQEFEFKISA